MQDRVIREPIHHPEPACAGRRPRLGIQYVSRFHRAEVDGPVLGEDTSHFGRDAVGLGADELKLRAKGLGRRRIRRLGLMLKPRLLGVEGGRKVEDGLAVLDGGDPPGGEASAVPEPVHKVDDGGCEIAGKDEVAVDGVGLPRLRQGPARRHQRLGQYLATEDPPGADVPIPTPVDVELQYFQVQKGDELVDAGRHDTLGRNICSNGFVVGGYEVLEVRSIPRNTLVDSLTCALRPPLSGKASMQRHPAIRIAPLAGPALFLALLLAPVTPASAQGFSFFDQSACAMARAGAGVALPCDDGSALFYNPAAVAGQTGVRASLGTVALFSRGDFTDDRTRTTTEMDNPLGVAPHLFVHSSVSDRATLGLAVYAPYAFATRWPREFQGSFVSFDSSLSAAFIQPTLAYRLHDRLSIGVGGILAVSSVDLNRRQDLSLLRLSEGSPRFGELGVAPGTAFAETNLSSDRATGYGAHLALQARLSDRLTLGARMLSRVTLDYEGRASFQPVETGIVLPAGNPLGLPAGTPLDLILAQAFTQGPLVRQWAATEITLPAQVVVGLGLQASPDLRLALDYQWINWSTFDSVELQFENPDLNDTLIQDYRNADAIRVGAEYALGERWGLRAGYLYNRNASPDQTVTPLVPEGERNHLTAGVGVELAPGVRLDAAYHYMRQNDRRGRTLNPLPGDVPSVDLNDGLYRVHAHLLGFTLSLGR